MSYSFDMYFTSAETELIAYQKAINFTKSLQKRENAWPLIDEYLDNFLSTTTPDYDSILFHRMLTGWLNMLFSVKFVYWPHEKLLGIGGDFRCIDKNFENLHHVYFQNSCNQDYDYQEWPNEIPFFANEKDDILWLSEETLLSEVPDDEKSDMDKEAQASYAEFLRRLRLYRQIFQDLDLNAWLYGDDSTTFFRFSTNAIETDEQRMKLSLYVQKKLSERKPESR